jgi:hypothetical protein
MVGGTIMDGMGGIQSVKLTQNITSSSTVIYVTNTSGFLYSDYVTIGGEDIRYWKKTSNTLLVASNGRGYNGTTAATHNKGSMARNQGANIVNSILGYNVVSTDSEATGISMGIAVLKFFTVSLPKLGTWDFPQFKTTEWTQFIRMILIMLSAGITIWIIYSVLSNLGGVAQSTLVR